MANDPLAGHALGVCVVSSTAWGGGCNCCCRIWNLRKCDWTTDDYSLWTFAAAEASALIGTTARLLGNPLHDAGFSFIAALERSSDSGNAEILFAYQDADTLWRIDVTPSPIGNGYLSCDVYERASGSDTLKTRYLGKSNDYADGRAAAVISAGTGTLCVHYSRTEYVTLTGFPTTGGMVGLGNVGGETTRFMALDNDAYGHVGMTGYATSGDTFPDFDGAGSLNYETNDWGLANCQKVRTYEPQTPCINHDAPLLQLSVVTHTPSGTPSNGTFDLSYFARNELNAVAFPAVPTSAMILLSDTATNQWILVLQEDAIQVDPTHTDAASGGFLLFDDQGYLRFSRAGTLESVTCTSLSGYTLAPVINANALETATSSASLTSA